MDPMILSVLYVWCQLNKDMVVSFWFGTRFKVSITCTSAVVTDTGIATNQKLGLQYKNIWATQWENLFMPYANNKKVQISLHFHAVWSAPLLFAA